jgi:tetratricopeptide (TPR) repeat protein
MKTLPALLLICYFPLYSQSVVDKARVLYEARKYDESIRLLKTVGEKDATYAASQYYLGRIAYDQKDYDAAEEYLEEAIDVNPNVADYHYWLATVWGNIARDANVLKQGMLAPKIKDEYEATVKLDPKNMDALWGLIGFYTEAPGVMGGSFEKAIETAGAIAKLDQAEGHRARGTIYEEQEKYAEAEKEFLAAYKLKPATRQSLISYYVRRQQYDKAFVMLDEALVSDPGNMLIVYQFGRTSAITGQRTEKGEECLKQYLTHQPRENEPSHGGAHMRLGQIYEKRGNKAEAKRSYQAALKIDQSLKEAKEGLDRVSK